MPRAVRSESRHRAAAALFALLGLAACSPSPLAPPLAAPLPPSYREASPAEAASPAAPADWRAFADPQLDAWQARALAGNPTLAQAAARVDRAAAALGAAAAEARPRVDFSAAASRREGALVNDAGGQGNLFEAGFGLRWDVDLFQRLSRQQQAAVQDLQAQRALHRQARLALQADVAQAYLAWRLSGIEGRVMDELLSADRALAAAATGRVSTGLAPVAQHEAALLVQQADEAEAQQLLRRRARLAHALVALAGGEGEGPGASAAVPLAPPEVSRPPMPFAALALPVPPPVPPGLPSQLLQRRPDIAAAEARLQAARLRLGLARDAWFPSLTLTAQAGLASGELGQWLQAAARSSGLGLLLALPAFDGGRRDAERAAAEAALDEAAAAHRAQVIAALREVEDQLVALRTLGEEARLRALGTELMAQAQARAYRQWQQGLLPATEAWRATRAVLLQQRQWIQAEAARTEATVALVHALGGGWGGTPVTE